MRKHLRIVWICLLILSISIGSMSSLFVTYAAGTDVTNQVAGDFIQGVDLKEKVAPDPVTGSMVGNTLIGQPDLDKTTDFYLWYDFMVPNVHSIVEGDYLLFDVPQAIALPGGGNVSVSLPALVTEDGDTIATASLEPGNKIKIVFTDAVETLSDVGGAFYIAGSFDQDEINTDGTTTEIDFTIPNNQVVLSFKADPLPEPDPVTVQKDGARTTGTDIGWKITVNKEDVAVANAVVVDPIPTNQDLNVSSILVNGAAIDPAQISYENGTLRISLGDITTKQEITFSSSLKSEALLSALEEGDTSINVINNATLEHDDNETTNADSPKTVTIPINILSKSGVKLNPTTASNTKNIKWTVVVNSDELTFNNAVITDTLPAGLTYVTGSATVTGATGVVPAVSGNNMTFNLGNITNEVTITYETQVDPSKFQANTWTNYSNKAVMTWDGLTGDGVEKSANVGIGSSLFIKSGAGYNRSNGVISWSMAINNENINLAAPTITDVIPSGQKYIEGSAKIVDHNGNAYGGGSFAYDAGTSTLTYTFNSAISSKYTITFDTKPATTNDITANGTGEFKNTATFTSGAISISSEGKQNYTSNVFKKDQAGYNPSTRVITWKFTVNENGDTTPSSNATVNDPSLYNAISLVNVSISDSIPAGLEFVAGSVKVVDKNDAPVTGLVTTSGTSDVIFSFNNGITEKYIITFETKITDLSKFISQNNTLNNGNFNVSNSASLTHNKTTITSSDDATQVINNHIVSKKGIPTAWGNKYVDWVVYINSNAVNLNQLLDVDTFWFIDQLQPGLELDTTSVTLTKYSGAITVPDSVPADGNDGLVGGTDEPLNGDHIKYDASTREFRLNFPGNSIATAYKLSFRTFVTESVQSGASFSNSINLHGSKEGVSKEIDSAYQSGDQRQVSFLEAGSVGYGSLGKIVVKKVDLDNPNVKLSGATFGLYDRFGNKVQEKTTVDGEVEFNRIKSDLPYYVKEQGAPVGYLLSGEATIGGAAATLTTSTDPVDEAVEVKLLSVQNQKSIELIFKNEQIQADIEFIKNNENNAALAGAAFGLYATGTTTNPIKTATSNAVTGKVLFEDVPFGQYDLREITAPAGYVTLLGVVDQVEVTAADHDTTITLDPVANSLIKANIKLVKQNGSGAGLAGATFGLYDSDDELVDSKTSGANGIVLFEDILAGVYTIKETAAPPGYLPLTGTVKTVTVAEAQHATTIDLGIVSNTLIESTIEFVKHDESNQPLAGATFGLYNSSNTLVDSATSGADGKLTFSNVGEGTYTIRETTAPTGYLPIDGVVYNVTITSADHGLTKELDPVVNSLIRADVELVKHDENGEPLSGAEFGLFVRGTSTTPVKTAISQPTTGKVLFEDVAYGQYDVREITAPFGYRTLQGVVDQVNVTASDDGKTLTLDPVANTLIKAKVKLVKQDNNGDELKGAAFGLYNSSNELKYSATSDEDGVVEFVDVLAGDYTLRETAAPYGYVPITGNVRTVTVTETDHATTIDLGTVSNTLIQTNIEFVKHNDNSQPLAGATFGLYNTSNVLVDSATSGADGKIAFSNVGEGQYTIRETAAPTGYLPISGVVYTVAITSADHGDTIELDPVANTLIEADIQFVKQNEKGEPLAGALFGLYERGAAVGTSPIKTFTSNTDGKILFQDVGYGQYEVREITAPFGYRTLQGVVDQVNVTVADHGKTLTLDPVANALIKANVKLVKQDENGEELKDATFGLYNSSNELKYSATSDEDGVVEFVDVLAGDYIVKEITAPFGYLPIEGTVSTVTVAEVDHATTIDLGTVTNTLIQASIEFVKNNESNQPLPDATFGLYNSSNVLVKSVVTGADGKVTFTEVGEGRYTIKEIAPPFGYLLLEGVVYTVNVTADDHGKTIPLSPVANTLIEADIQFTKLNDKGNVLADAQFGLYDQHDALVKSVTSNAEGKVIFTDVREGAYVIREIQEPVGYNLLTSDVHAVRVTADEHNTTIQLASVTNYIIKGNIEFVKVDSVTQRPLKRAVFALYAADDTSFTTEIATAQSDDNGLVRFTGVEYGDYTIVEVVAPSGYYRSKEQLSAQIRDEGQTYHLGNFDNKALPAIVIEGTIEISKKNELGDSLAGAKFGLYDVMDRLVAEGVSNNSGIVRFTELPEGVYTVKELEAPEKYVASDQVEEVAIAENKDYVKLTFVNERSSDAPWPSVAVKKVDDAGKPLAGVSFAIYKGGDTAFNVPIATSKTNANGIATFENITPGNYVVKEIAALEGYILNAVALPITVTDDKELFEAGTVENSVIRGDIVVDKVNEQNEPLEGAEFALYNSAGELVATAVSDRNGNASFKDIPYGSYNLQELAAPATYEKSDDVVAVKITDGKTQTITFVNKKVDLAGQRPELNQPDNGSDGNGGTGSNSGSGNGETSNEGTGVSSGKPTQTNELPKTGDNIATMLIMFIGSGLLLFGLFVLGRRKAQSKNN